MAFDPENHHRRSIRLKGYNYAQPGAYFVTICVRERECLLGRVENGVITLSRFGLLVEECWCALPSHFANLELDEYVVMPNHIHGIVVIAGTTLRRGEAFARWSEDKRRLSPANASPLQPPPGTAPGSLGAIAQNFKSVSTRKINQARVLSGAPVWQRNYYEHVIRDEAELTRVRQYIHDNPAQWETDEYNPNKQA